MAREIRNVITLDSSRFERGARAVTRWVDRLHGGLTGTLRAGVRLARRTIMALAAALAGLTAAMIEGTRRVLNYADELHNLSMQTGMTVSRMMVLKQAFKDSNVEASQLEVAVRDMQRRLIEAERPGSRAAEAMGKIGIPLSRLRRMDPATQFEEIANAINKIEDPAMRTYVASELLGRSGARVLRVFERGAVETAARSIGAQAELLERNAEMFSEAADILNRVGVKVRGFFVGVADRVVPALMPLLRRFDELDLAEQGQRFGKGIERGARYLLAAMRQDRLGELFRQSLLVGATEFASVMMAASIAAGEVFVKTVMAGIMEFGERVGDKTSDFVSMSFGGITDMIGKALQAGPATETGKRVSEFGRGMFDQARAQREQADEGVFGFVAQRMGEEFTKRMEGLVPRFMAVRDQTSGQRGEQMAAYKELLKELEADLASGEERAAQRAGRRADEAEEREDDFDQHRRPAADSLAAIGLGGGLAGGLQEAVQESNKYLNAISDDIAAMRERMVDGGGLGHMDDGFGEVRL